MTGRSCAVVTGATLFLCATLGVIAIDRLARPRRGRDAAALAILLPTVLLGFALTLLLTGSAAAAATVTLAAASALVVGSNAKFRVLGEPACFSDAASLRMLISHPGFYLAALSMRARLAGAAASLLIAAGLAAAINVRPMPRLVALALAGLAAALLRRALRRADARGRMVRPDLEADVARWGLIPSIVAYARHWRRSDDPPPPAALAPAPAPMLVVVVQCESFVDPASVAGLQALIGKRDLPGLARARRLAFRHGALAVPGFGAYTMRTEYGVLFGRAEDGLGFRRYDPYLTAASERAHALPVRLAPLGYRSCFLHPYELAFYRRSTLMPAIGFDIVLGPEAFGPDAARVGPYVADMAVADRIAAALRAAAGPQFVYAVTMENHGPHDAGRLPGCATPALAWAHHLGNADRMLDRLIDLLLAETRTSLLVFLGDHRPSISGAIEPDGGRDTPYVVIRFDGRGGTEAPEGESDCTPAGLYDIILGQCAREIRASRPSARRRA